MVPLRIRTGEACDPLLHPPNWSSKIFEASGNVEPRLPVIFDVADERHPYASLCITLIILEEGRRSVGKLHSDLQQAERLRMWHAEPQVSKIAIMPAARPKKENHSTTPPSDDGHLKDSLSENSKSKRKRQSQSCDACRARKVRCARENPDDPKQSCKHCITLGIPCTYDYQPKKRGPPNLYLRRLQEAAAAAANNQQSSQHQHQPDGSPDMEIAASPISTLASPSQSMVSPTIGSKSPPSFLESPINPLSSIPSVPIPPSRYPIAADTYHTHYQQQNSVQSASFNGQRNSESAPNGHGMMLPHSQPKVEDQQYASSPTDGFSTYPLYNWSYKQHQMQPAPVPSTPSFMADLHSRREERDPLFFALVMSTVASTLVQVPRSYLPMERPVVRKLAQTAHEASRHITVASYDPPTSMHVVIRYFDCIYHFCEGHDATQHAAFGEAAHIAVTLRMHEEASYEGLDPIECEVRRRIFWLLFGADKSMSILLGRPICLRDEDCTVHFPKELDDEYAYLPQPHGKTAIVSGLNYTSRIFALLGEILVRIRVDKRSPPQGQFATARLEEVQSLHNRILAALSHAPEPLRLKQTPSQPHVPPEYGGPGFRQATFAEVKDFFDNPNASRANALNPFLVMQANLFVTQQLVRFVIEQYRDELLMALQGNLDEQQVAQDREAVASDLLNILHSIPIQSIATNGPSLVHKVRFVASTLLDAVRKAEIAPASAARAHAYLSFLKQNQPPNKEPRLEVAKSRIESLNPLVVVEAITDTSASEDERLESVVKRADLVCVTDWNRDGLVRINELCRRHRKRFYAGGTYGLVGYIFCDLLSHEYLAPDRSAPKDQPTTVKATADYPPLSLAIISRWSTLTKRQTKEVNPALFFVIMAIWQFESKHSRLPNDVSDTNELETISNSLISEADVNKQVLTAVPRDFVEPLSTTAAHEFSPVCAIVGGMLAQDILKALGGREPPIANFFVFDGNTGGGTVCRLNMP
ncbi:hypothetical protein NLJ89_g2874 [Agrocybe chaxingu]|uniref:Zn(2)-C6 fungal-type domain-containing protein n=1 Tax=Agrocybe chaxingu TaxID=84603 RepID=A0A9W8MXS8_9AGAR|nr:hypothetical protein NLJ89_g2874 [Agrocybe chaxingu]